METVGIEIERQHHEVATAGQAEIDIRFDTLVKCADKLQWFKYIIKNVAAATARRRPSCRSRSSATTARACTRHQSLWKSGKPLFAGDGYAGLSRAGACTTSAAS